VSPTYAREIQTPDQGYGLDGIIRARSASLSGILNGVDYEVWSPSTDRFIPFRYSEKSLFRKKKNKNALADKLRLALTGDEPLVGMVTRLSAQKGIDLLERALPEVLSREPVRLVVLGTGEKRYESFFASLQLRFPERVCFYRGFSDELAHWIEAAADMFLPSCARPAGSPIAFDNSIRPRGKEPGSSFATTPSTGCGGRSTPRSASTVIVAPGVRSWSTAWWRISRGSSRRSDMSRSIANS
jgi:glycogen synthase